MSVPASLKIYHIVHVDRLASIVSDGYLWSDAVIVAAHKPGTAIGMSSIKRRRLSELRLTSHPTLFVGECVPFYFCPRSVMLYLLSCANHPELTYHGGQGPIVHLEADLREAVAWAEEQNRRWAFTLSNAGAYYFEDRKDLSRLNEINWDAVDAHRWSGSDVSRQVKEGKQAEFLMEASFPWHLVRSIGVHSQPVAHQASLALGKAIHRPVIEVRRNWYY